MNTKASLRKPTTHERFRVSEQEAKKYICSKLGLSEYDYNLNQYETGLRFLDSYFPSSDEFYVKYYGKHERSKTFWNWFKNEWHIMEQDLVKHYIERDMKFTFKLWVDEMDHIYKIQKVENSFHQFIKIFDHGRI